MTGPPEGVWPFLVCRGRSIGSRVVLAPDVLADARAVSKLLATRPSGRGRWEVPARQPGFEVIVRESIVEPWWLGQDDLVRDVESRPISATEGALLRATGLSDDEVFELVRRAIIGPFAEFWSADDPGWTPRLTSHAGELVTAPADWQLELNAGGGRPAGPRPGPTPEAEPDPAPESPDQPVLTTRPSSPALAIAIVVAIAVALVVMAMLLR